MKIKVIDRQTRRLFIDQTSAAKSKVAKLGIGLRCSCMRTVDPRCISDGGQDRWTNICSHLVMMAPFEIVHSTAVVRDLRDCLISLPMRLQRLIFEATSEFTGNNERQRRTIVVKKFSKPFWRCISGSRCRTRKERKARITGRDELMPAKSGVRYQNWLGLASRANGSKLINNSVDSACATVRSIIAVLQHIPEDPRPLLSF